MSIEIEMGRIQRKIVTVNSIEEVKKFVRDGWVVDMVGDTEVVGMCEICELPILESDDFYADKEGVCWHKSCDKGEPA